MYRKSGPTAAYADILVFLRAPRGGVNKKSPKMHESKATR
jgi:hypothetical protein